MQVVEIGRLAVPSGRLAVGDPLTIDFSEPQAPLQRRTPTGVFPVELAIARFSDPADARVACARVTSRLRAALQQLATSQHDPNTRVILRDDGTPASKRVVDGWLYRAQQAAGMAKKGPHILRHTFCSRLALRGATPKAIKELAGHVHSSTTDRYLHLAPSALKTAIELLDTPCRL